MLTTRVKTLYRLLKELRKKKSSISREKFHCFDFDFDKDSWQELLAETSLYRFYFRLSLCRVILKDERVNYLTAITFH